MRRFAIGCFLAGCLALALLPAAYADGYLTGTVAPATALVYPSVSGICSTTLKACLAGSGDGDSITVLPGAYVTDMLIISRSITLLGSGAPTTTLRANGNHGVIRIDTAASPTAAVVISGLRVISGNVGLGAGVYAPGGAPVTLVNMEVFSNHTSVSGGGIYAVGPITLVNVNVSYNTASSGDGGGLQSATQPVVINGGQFFSNTANQNGGAMRVNGPLTLNNVLILSNTAAAKHGGGVFAGSVVVMNFGGLYGNTAGTDGGGLYARGSVSLFNAEVRRNSAVNNGGGLLVSGTVALTISAVTGNHADVSGGGMYVTGTAGDFLGIMAINTSTLRGGAIFVSGSLGLNGSLLSSNQTQVTGGGAHVTGTLSVTNVKVISNSAFFGAGLNVAGSGMVTNSLFQGNIAIEHGGGLAGTVLDVADSNFHFNQALILGGAGILAENTLRLSGGLLQDNLASQCTGVQAPTLTVRSTQFIHNQSLFAGGGACATSGGALDGVLFQANSARTSGGGLLAGLNPLILTDTQFISNSATERGGGLFALGVVTLAGGLFESNTVTTTYGLGGGMAVSGMALIVGTHFVSNSAAYGGGAYVTATLETISQTLFENNFARKAGGGAYAATSMRASGTTFRANAAGNDPADFGAGGGLTAANVSMTNTLFISNTASNDGGGLQVGTLDARSVQFTGNHAENLGGGLLAILSARLDDALFQRNQAFGGAGLVAHTLLGNRLQFLDNQALSEGGGALVNVRIGESVILTSSVFLRNSASYAGGLLIQPGDFAPARTRIVNSLFADNSASVPTGAADILQENLGPVEVLHTTFAQNGSNPRAAIINVTGTLSISDSIIVSHSIAISGTGGVAREDYNLFAANGFDRLGTVNIGGHSFGGSPRFLGPATDNYHLGPHSDAMDRGIDTGVAFDVDGDARPFGAGFDIGYDEASWRDTFLPMIRR